MPFEAMHFERKIKDGPAGSISYTKWGKTSKTGKKFNTRAMLVVGLNAEACAKFKIDKNVYYRLLIGSGTHKGWLRIAPAKKGDDNAVQPVALKGKTACFRFGYSPLLGEDTAAKEDIAPRALTDGPGCEFAAPAWFKGDEQAEPSRRVA